MSISRTRQPNTLAFSNDRLLFTYTSTEFAQPGFRYALTISVHGKSYTSYVQPNPSNALIFDASQYLKDLVVPDEKTSMGEPLVSATYSGVKFRVSNKAAGKAVVTVQEYYSGALQGVANTYTFYVIAGHGMIHEGQNPVRTSYAATSAPPGWVTSRSTNVYTMGDGVTTPSIRLDMASATTAWMARLYSTAVGSVSQQIRYRIYNGATTVATHTTDLNTTNGATFAFGAAVPTAGQFMLYIPIGPAHITSIYGTNLTTTPWTHIRVCNMYSGSPLDDILIVNEDGSCKHDDTWVLYANRLGGLDMLKFDARRKEDHAVESKSIVRPIGSFSGSDALFYATERTKEAIANTAVVTHTLMKTGVTPEESTLLAELARSRMIWAYIGGRWRPLVVENHNAAIVVGRTSRMQTAEITFVEAQDMRC
jgi:hypothetical protein